MKTRLAIITLSALSFTLGAWILREDPPRSAPPAIERSVAPEPREDPRLLRLEAEAVELKASIAAASARRAELERRLAKAEAAKAEAEAPAPAVALPEDWKRLEPEQLKDLIREIKAAGPGALPTIDRVLAEGHERIFDAYPSIASDVEVLEAPSLRFALILALGELDAPAARSRLRSVLESQPSLLDACAATLALDAARDPADRALAIAALKDAMHRESEAQEGWQRRFDTFVATLDPEHQEVLAEAERGALEDLAPERLQALSLALRPFMVENRPPQVDLIGIHGLGAMLRGFGAEQFLPEVRARAASGYEDVLPALEQLDARRALAELRALDGRGNALLGQRVQSQILPQAAGLGTPEAFDFVSARYPRAPAETQRRVLAQIQQWLNRPPSGRRPVSKDGLDAAARFLEAVRSISAEPVDAVLEQVRATRAKS